MKPSDLLADVLSRVENKGKAAEAMPEGGMPDPLPVPPEVVAGPPEGAGMPVDLPPAETGRPEDLPPEDTGRPDDLPPAESAAVEFEEATGLPLIAARLRTGAGRWAGPFIRDASRKPRC